MVQYPNLWNFDLMWKNYDTVSKAMVLFVHIKYVLHRVCLQNTDLLAVKYLLDSMEPDMVIDTSEGQAHWIENVQRYRPVVEHLLYGDTETTTARTRLVSAIK